MHLNSLSNVSFGAHFAVLGNKKYTPRQAGMIKAVKQDIINNNDEYSAFENLNDNCYIIAKPVGKTGIAFQAYRYDERKWYDKIGYDINTGKSYILDSFTAHSKDDAKAYFFHLSNGIPALNGHEPKDRYDNYNDVEAVNYPYLYTQPMKNPPQRVNIVL